MRSTEGETIDGALLERLGDWADRDAWSTFVGRYDGLVRRAVATRQRDADAVEEIRQRIWIELADRMRDHRHAPPRYFRAWLIRLCRSRAMDQLRRRRAESARAGFGEVADLPAPVFAEDDDAARPALLRRASRIQEAVMGRVDARTWDVFRRIAVEDEAVAEVAKSVGLSYAAAFAAQKRVRRMLREEAALAGVGVPA